jgi:nucleotide-binding universal stress UspA family protein
MKILCATDLLPKTDAAIERAHQLRAELGGRLTLMHVVIPGTTQDGTLEQRLLSANSRLAGRARRATAPVELVVRCGRPAKIVAETARSRHADLVVIGPHEIDPVADAIKGTLTEHIVGEARCPVLIVRRRVRDEYRSVMLALDGSPTSRHVIDAAETLGLSKRGVDRRLTAIHAHEPPYEAMMTSVGVGDASVAKYAAATFAQAAEAMRAELRARSNHPERYRLLVAEGRPVPAIRRAMEEVEPDLVMLGTRGLGRFRRAMLGSTANDILRSTDCDVLLVPETAVRAARRAQARGAGPSPDDFGPGAA